MKKSKLQKIAAQPEPFNAKSVINLLLKDHRAMKKLMAKIRSKRSTHQQVWATFIKLEKLVYSHMRAEETSLLHRIKEHKIFEDETKEGIEEHHIHESIMSGIHKLKEIDRKITQIKIFCEFLEHHLKEEENDLFPVFRKHTALSTRRKMGAIFMKRRQETKPAGKQMGALASSSA